LRSVVPELLWRDRVLAVTTLSLLLLVAVAVFGPVVWTEDPRAVDLAKALQEPSWAHPLGTDGFGRDVLARVIEGARISLVVGTAVALAGAMIGGALGLLAGAFAGGVDTVAMRLVDALLAFPPLMLAMAITVGLGAGLATAGLAITVACVPWYARLVRSEVLRLRSLPFVEAAAVLGASRRRILARHVVPHIVPTVLIQMSSMFGIAVMTLAALGFVGLGAQIPTPEWGAMITEGQQYALVGAWWISVFPGIALLIAVTATSVLAERVRDLLDPRGEFSRG
jgi:peptide/nickel transport system permease protein